MVLNGIEWYYKLPLRIPLSPTEIPLNGPMVQYGIKWYTIGSFFVRAIGNNIVYGLFSNISKLVYDT